MTYFSSVNEDNMVVVNVVSIYLYSSSSEHLVESYFLFGPLMLAVVMWAAFPNGMWVEIFKSACKFQHLSFPYNYSVQDEEGLSSCVLMWKDISGAPTHWNFKLLSL